MVDFQKNSEKARKQINSWVEQKTLKKIRDLLPAGTVDPSTQVYNQPTLHWFDDKKEIEKQSPTKTKNVLNVLSFFFLTTDVASERRLLQGPVGFTVRPF